MKVWSWSNIFLHPDYYYNRGTAVRTWAMADIRFRKELSSDPYANKRIIVLAVAGVALVILGVVMMGVYIGRGRLCTLLGSITGGVYIGVGSIFVIEAWGSAFTINSVRKDREGLLLDRLLRSHNEAKLRKHLRNLHEWVHEH